jgi:8-amino-7-oxononanoate synthase
MTDWSDLRQALDQLAADGLLRTRDVFERTGLTTVRVRGRELINFAANDYLGLAGSERLRLRAQELMAEVGPGASASPLVSGRSPLQARAEADLARFEGQASTLLFPSGYAANLGVVAALVKPGDLVLCDRFNHACLVDGCRLSGAALRVYRHDDLDTLRGALCRAAQGQRVWIVTDSVFSMDGDLAPLAEICDLAESVDARVVVDEAHGTGIYGAHRRGVVEELGVEERVAVRIGTLSKSLGGQGGFVTGPTVLVDYLYNHARTQMFSTALSPWLCAVAIAAVEAIIAEPDRSPRVRALATRLRTRLRAQGLTPLGRDDCPIVPLVLKHPARVMDAGHRLETAGFLVGTIRPPTVPRGTARLRVSLSAAHTDAQIDQLAAVLSDPLTTGETP